ncbi:MAG: hypothetical protein ACK46Q_14780, partial [Hyphomonas sp.]
RIFPGRKLRLAHCNALAQFLLRAVMMRALFLNAYTDAREDAPALRFALLWAIGLPLLLFPVFTFILTTALLALGATLAPLTAWLILGISAASALTLPRLFIVSGWPLAAALSLAAGVLAFLIASLLHDTSIDGQHYHFQAAYGLAEGWNPLRGGREPPVIGDTMTLWALHYPRGGWVFAGNLLAAGLPLSTLKAINFLLLFAAAALVAGTLIRLGFSALFAALLTAAAVLNPVITSQLFTGMNDGLFGLCLIIFTAALAVWIRHDEAPALIAALAAMILAMNLKFSAIPILFILSAFTCLATFLVSRHRRTLHIAAALFGSAIVGVIVLGWSPYVQNYLDFGHVFYPIMGPNAVDIMTGAMPELENTPKVLEPLSPAGRFLFSLFSQTHSGYETTASLKIPFFATPAELRAAGDVDTRLAGFGPFFSGIVLLAIVCAVTIALNAKRRNPVTLGLLFTAAAMLLSVLLMPQNWWARYVPQFWLAPACIAAAAITLPRLPVQIFGTLIALVMLLNAGLTTASGLWLTTKRSAAVNEQINTMANTDQSYCVYPDMVHSRLYLMREAGIQVQYAPRGTLTCSAPEEIAGYGPDRHGGQICLCPSQ